MLFLLLNRILELLNYPRRKIHFARDSRNKARFNSDREKNRFRKSANQAYAPHVPVRMRGVRVVTKRWAGNAMDVGVSERLGATSDALTDGEIVWSWRRDPGAKPAKTRLAGDGGKTGRSPGRARIIRKPSRGECRDVSAEPVVTAACFLCCRRAMGAASSRHSPRPHHLEGESFTHHPARIARRDRSGSPADFGGAMIMTCSLVLAFLCSCVACG